MIIANSTDINTYKKNLRKIHSIHHIMFHKDETNVKEIIKELIDNHSTHIIMEYYTPTFKIDYNINHDIISFKNDYLNLDVKYICCSSLKPSYLKSNILSKIKCYNCILFYNTFTTVFGNMNNQKIENYIPISGIYFKYDCKYVGDNTFTIHYCDDDKIYFHNATFFYHPVYKMEYVFVRNIDEMKITIEILKILIEATLSVIN